MKSFFTQYKFISVVLIFALAFPASLSAEPSDTYDQETYYRKASKGNKSALKAHKIALGLWSGVAALCGYNCFQYLVGLRLARNSALSTAMIMNANITKAAGVCPPVAPAAGQATPILAAMQGQNASAEAQAQKGTAAQAAPLMGSTAATLPAEEMMSASLKKLSAVNKEAIGLATQAVADFTPACASGLLPAAPVACAAKAACASSIKLMTSSEAPATKAQLKLDTMIPKIIAKGKLCALTSLGVAGTDMGLSMAVAKDTTEGLIALAGAAPGAIGLMRLYLSKNYVQNPPKQANAMGISSCFTTGISAFLIAKKMINIKNTNKALDQNRKRLEEINGPVDGIGTTQELGEIRSSLDLQEDLPVEFTQELKPTMIEQAFKAAGYIYDSMVSCAVAADQVAQNPKEFNLYLSACEESKKSQPELLACSYQGDSLLKDFLSTESHKTNEFFTELERTLQVSRSTFVSENPPAIEKTISLMTKDTPQLTNSVLNLYYQVEKKASFQLMPDQNPMDRSISEPKLALIPSQDISTPTTNFEASKELDTSSRSPAGENPQAQNPDSIFDLATKQYQKCYDRLDPQDWAVPYNRSIRGLPLKPSE